MQKSRKGKTLAVVGAQFGSEGKGVIVASIANNYGIHVRTGGPNAGHTFSFMGASHVMQTIPCGWINPNAHLLVGIGALITIDQLDKEIEHILQFDSTILDRLSIDENAGVISQWHQDEEGGVEGEMHKRIGSTGKGVGAARRDRMMRNPDKFKRIRDVWTQSKYLKATNLVKDTGLRLNEDNLKGESILLEGAQGTGLDLLHGPWPYVTSNGCTAAQMCADCGLAPTQLDHVLVVARTFPIRVAGNSGPLKGEVDWGYISDRVGKPTTEKTTVTKKTRRIAHWDDDLMDMAVLLNGADLCALTFVDYLSPEDEGKTTWAELSQKTKDFIQFVEQRFKVQVCLVGTGGEGWRVIKRSEV